MSTWDEVLAAYAARLEAIEHQVAGRVDDAGTPEAMPELPSTPEQEPTADQRRQLLGLMERNAAAQALLAAQMEQVRAELGGLGARRTAAREYTRTG